MRARLGAALVAFLISGLTGCGAEAGGSLSAATRDGLHQRVTAIRDAVEAERFPAARRALDRFRSEVEGLRGSGAISPADAAALLARGDRIGADLPAPAPAPAPSEEPPPATPTSEPDADDDEAADEGDDGEESDEGRGNLQEEILKELRERFKDKDKDKERGNEDRDDDRGNGQGRGRGDAGSDDD